MEDFFEPTHIVDFTDKATRKRIRAAKCGESVVVKVHIPNQPDAFTREAIGTRSLDGKQFDVRLINAQGKQDFGWNYEDVLVLVDSCGKP